jgi:uncharacterized protein (UPF0264 family)
VIFADEPYDLAIIDAVADAGFAGAMLDTAHKTGKSLRDWQNPSDLRAFLQRARNRGLLSGLAGSLCRADIEPLLLLEPDYLGFRGALCRQANRALVIDAQAFGDIRAALPRHGVPAHRPGMAAA